MGGAARRAPGTRRHGDAGRLRLRDTTPKVGEEEERGTAAPTSRHAGGVAAHTGADGRRIPKVTEGALPEVAVHSAVASGEPLDAAAGEPLVGRQGPVNAPLMRATRSAKGVQVAAVR